MKRLIDSRIAVQMGLNVNDSEGINTSMISIYQFITQFFYYLKSTALFIQLSILKNFWLMSIFLMDTVSDRDSCLCRDMMKLKKMMALYMVSKKLSDLKYWILSTNHYTHRRKAIQILYSHMR